jgi:hypothetical protein
MSLEFLMGYFNILNRIETASTSHRPEQISLRIEECIDFKSGSGASSSRGMRPCKSARADPEDRGSLGTPCGAGTSEEVSSPHQLELGPPTGKDKDESLFESQSFS